LLFESINNAGSDAILFAIYDRLRDAALAVGGGMIMSLRM
jgi:hypothetical protein